MEISYLETEKILNNSREFADFKIKHKEALFCGGFFIDDCFGNDKKRAFDFLENDKVYTCSLDEHDNVEIKEDKLRLEAGANFPKLMPFMPIIKVDFPEASGIAKIQALDEGIHSKFSKIIGILQSIENKTIWNFTCMLEGLIIIHVLVSAEDGKVIKFERKSMMDLIRKKGN